MRIMVVGGGGREHTIIRKLAENKDIEKISGYVDEIQSEAIQFDTIVSRNEQSVYNITEKNRITKSMVEKLDELIISNVKTSEEIDSIVKKFH